MRRSAGPPGGEVTAVFCFCSHKGMFASKYFPLEADEVVQAYIVPVLGSLRKEDHKFKASLFNIASSRLAWAT